MQTKCDLRNPPQRLNGTGETIAGGLAGAISRFLVTPLDVIKIRMQLERGLPSTSEHTSKSGMLRTARLALAEEGIVSLWRGNAPAMLLWISYAGVQFPVYGAMKRALSAGTKPAENNNGINLSTSGPSNSVLLLSGAASSAIATFVSYPLDWARTRMASQGIPRVHKSTLSLLWYTLATEVCVCILHVPGYM